MYMNMVASEFGKLAGSLPKILSWSRSFAKAAANWSGIVLYAEASHPSPSRATRRKPASEPQLPIQIGGLGFCSGLGSRSIPAVE